MHVHPFFPYWPFDRVHVGSRQFYSRFKFKSKFVSEFVGPDKPTKFVGCRFVSSRQLNPSLTKLKVVSEFVGTDKPTKFVSCRFVSSCQLNPSLTKLKVVSEFVGTDKLTEILHSSAEMRICKGWIKTWIYDSEKYKTLDTEGAIESFLVKRIDFT